MRYRIEVDFSRGALKPSLEKPFEIRLRLGVYRFTGLGADSQHSFVALRLNGTPSSDADEDRLGNLVAHEVGHCLGLLNHPPAGEHAHDAWLELTHHHCKVAGCLMSYKALRGGQHGFHYDGATGTGCHEYLRRQDFSRGIMDFWD